jgi:HlyD family secretion protein
LELRAQASDLDIGKFKPGQRVAIATNEDEHSHVFGNVRLVSPQVDPSTRLGTVRIDLPSDAGLKPGMFVRGQVKLGEKQSVTVPVEAVVTHNGESVVFALDGERVRSTKVRTGARTDDFVEILDGLKAGQVVVVQGSRFLSDNDVVRVGTTELGLDKPATDASRVAK